MAPLMALFQVTGKPISRSRLLAKTAPLFESSRKLAVRVDVAPRQSKAGFAEIVSTRRGLTVGFVPPLPGATASQPSAWAAATFVGSVLHPHQLLVAVAVPTAPPARQRASPHEAEVLPRNLEKLKFIAPLFSMIPPPSAVAVLLTIPSLGSEKVCTPVLPPKVIAPP